MEQLRYPIGLFEPAPQPTLRQREGWIDEIADFPRRLHRTVQGLPAVRAGVNAGRRGRPAG